MAAPHMVYNAIGNIYATHTLAANTSISFDLDFSADHQGQVQAMCSAGATVGTPSGLQVSVVRGLGPGTPPAQYDTRPVFPPFTIPATASTPEFQSFALGTGKYRLDLKNLDTANAVSIQVTTAVIDGMT